MDMNGVPFPNVFQHGLKLGPVSGRTTHFVSKSLIDFHTIQLTFRVLVNRANPYIPDLCHFLALCIHLPLDMASMAVFIIKSKSIEYGFP
ncbi:hypothetical protein D9M71_676860 [compost metagenome]